MEFPINEEQYEKASLTNEKLSRFSHDTDSVCLKFIARLKCFIEKEIVSHDIILDSSFEQKPKIAHISLEFNN